MYVVDLVVKVARFRGDSHDNHCSSGRGIHTHKAFSVGNGLHTCLVVGATILYTITDGGVLAAMTSVPGRALTSEGAFSVSACSTKLAGTCERERGREGEEERGEREREREREIERVGREREREREREKGRDTV